MMFLCLFLVVLLVMVSIYEYICISITSNTVDWLMSDERQSVGYILPTYRL